MVYSTLNACQTFEGAWVNLGKKSTVRPGFGYCVGEQPSAGTLRSGPAHARCRGLKAGHAVTRQSRDLVRPPLPPPHRPLFVRRKLTWPQCPAVAERTATPAKLSLLCSPAKGRDARGRPRKGEPRPVRGRGSTEEGGGGHPPRPPQPGRIWACTPDPARGPGTPGFLLEEHRSGKTAVTGKRTCIPWIPRHEAVSSPCAVWPFDVRLHSKPP